MADEQHIHYDAASRMTLAGKSVERADHVDV